MSACKIALVYFSGTRVTRSYARAVRVALIERGCAVDLLDVTPFSARQAPLPVEDYDAFIFGFPVYSNFAPDVINSWLPTVPGQGKRCALFHTYGGRSSGFAVFHTAALLEQAGFQVMCAAEFPGPHTYNVAGWGILPDRPGPGDLAVAREFAGLALAGFLSPTPAPLRLPQAAGYPEAVARLGQPQPVRTERRWNHPTRVTDTCSMCRDCENECPTLAFNADTGLSDPVLCISCMHCLTICPDEVIHVDQAAPDIHEKTLERWHLTEETLRARQSRIVAD